MLNIEIAMRIHARTKLRKKWEKYSAFYWLKDKRQKQNRAVGDVCKFKRPNIDSRYTLN